MSFACSSPAGGMLFGVSGLLLLLLLILLSKQINNSNIYGQNLQEHTTGHRTAGGAAGSCTHCQGFVRSLHGVGGAGHPAHWYTIKAKGGVSGNLTDILLIIIIIIEGLSL